MKIYDIYSEYFITKHIKDKYNKGVEDELKDVGVLFVQQSMLIL